MEKLKEIVLTSNTRAGCIFDLSIQVLIIISLISFSIDTLPDIDKSLKEFLSTLETFIVIVFTIEYLLRIILTSPSSKYIFSFYGFIDIIAILPFYLSTSVSLQTLRILRLFRIIRIFKLTKYNQAYKRVAKSLSLAKEELILFLLLTLILLYLAAVGIYHFT
ncbi:MAG: voltage-gated potassium channel, partial [Cycloclasticus sp. symbiont of Poecilosclerida sp. M]